MANRVRVTDASAIGSKMEDTPEGFLICRDVPLARTGEQIYLAHEIRGLPAKNGRIIAQRDEDQVFHPDAIESFRGKPFTDDHPDDDVGPSNFKRHLIGTVMDPRRGQGAHAHCLVGDIMVYDPTAIAKIKAGKREVSNGYDADYEIIEPGRARQINIRGNHVSLVDEGRCGPTCAIRDRDHHIMAASSTKRPWFDSLRKAFSAKDEAEREQHLAAAESEMPDGGIASDGDGHHIVLNIGTPPTDDDSTKPKDAESGVKEGDPKEGTDMDEDKVKEIAVAAVKEAMTPVSTALEAITAKLEGMSTKVDETADKTEAVAEAIDDMSDPDDMGMQDAVARAEILAPGLSLPSRDAKPGSKAHRDAMGNYQRSALKQALTTDAGRVVVGAVLGHVQPFRITNMPANEVAVAFRAASQIMLDHNAAATADTLVSATAGTYRDAEGKTKQLDNRTWNDINAKHFGRKA